jgi:hypothetical protein
MLFIFIIKRGIILTFPVPLKKHISNFLRVIPPT